MSDDKRADDKKEPTCPACGKSLLVDGKYVRHEECLGQAVHIVPDDEAPDPEPADF